MVNKSIGILHIILKSFTINSDFLFVKIYFIFIAPFFRIIYNVLAGVGNLKKHIKTLNSTRLPATIKDRGCGECQTSCQSACKTSCTVGNQVCVKENER